MFAYTIRRLLLFIPVWFGVALLAFGLMRLIPGDPAASMATRLTSAEALADARRALGLDLPVHEQFGHFLAGALRGDLGRSFQSGMPVAKLMLERLPYTLTFAVTGLTCASLLGIALGVVAAVRRATWIDKSLMLGSLLFISVPGFWFAMLLIQLFSVWLRWIPVTATEGFRSLILPTLSLTIMGMPGLLRLTRAAMLDVLGSDYIRTARAKGLKESVVLYRHTLRNALIPIVTVLGLSFGGLLGGAFIVEQVFARPGVGSLLVQAILARDYPLVQGVVLYTSTVFLLINLVVDLSYGLIDPRIRYR